MTVSGNLSESGCFAHGPMATVRLPGAHPGKATPNASSWSCTGRALPRKPGPATTFSALAVRGARRLIPAARRPRDPDQGGAPNCRRIRGSRRRPKSTSAGPILPLTGGRVGHWAVVQSRGRRHSRASPRIHMRESHSAIDGRARRLWDRSRSRGRRHPRAASRIHMRESHSAIDRFGTRDLANSETTPSLAHQRRWRTR